MVDFIEATRRYVANRLTGKPLYVSIEITQACNADCGFCGYRRSNDNESRIPKGIGSYLPIILELNPIGLGYVGGEPLIRDDLEKLVIEAKSARVPYVQVTTNGSKLTPDRYFSLSDAEIDRLQISLDFPDPRHDEERGIPGLFDKITNFLQATKERRRTRIGINTILMNENIEDVRKILQLAQEYEVSVNLLPYNSVRNGGHNHAIIPSRVNEKFLSRLKEDYGSVIDNPSAVIPCMETFMEEGGYGKCDAGKSFLWVLPNGRILACIDHPSSEGDTLEEVKSFMDKNDCNRCLASCRSISEAATSKNPLILLRLARDLSSNIIS